MNRLFIVGLITAVILISWISLPAEIKTQIEDKIEQNQTASAERLAASQSLKNTLTLAPTMTTVVLESDSLLSTFQKDAIDSIYGRLLRPHRPAKLEHWQPLGQLANGIIKIWQPGEAGYDSAHTTLQQMW